MKIAIIQPWIRQGGAESLTVHLAWNLKKLGHQVKIITLFTNFEGLSPRAKVLEYITPNRYFSQLCEKSSLFRLIFGTPLLFLMTASNCRDVELINPHNFPSSWVAVVAGAFYHKPVVWTCNESCVKVSWRSMIKAGILSLFIVLFAPGWLDRILVKRIKEVIVLDKKNQKSIQTCYKRDSTIVNTGIDFNFYQSILSENKNFFIKKYNLKNKFILLTVGKLVPPKNQTLCIDCLKGIAPRINNAVLVIAGDGPLRKILEEKARDLGLEKCVRFAGFISNEELRDLYHICDVNLFPAVRQSWGMTPFEALCAKKISIVSNDCGAAEVIGGEEIGVVSQPTPKKFSENIIKIYNNPKYYQDIAQKGFRYVKEKMSWEQYAQKTYSVFLRVLSQK